MSPGVIKRTIHVGGIELDIFSGSESSRPVAVLFLLHGRPRTKEQVAHHADYIVKNTTDKSYPIDLLVVTFDHRNHGRRQLDPRANRSWAQGTEKHNPSHALDMYSIQHGTAHDVSFLIDHLPFHLYPAGERDIVTWSVAGISLGGHSTWICLAQEPRVTLGIPIIGCPDYEALMLNRAKTKGVELETAMPPMLINTIRRIDPIVKAREAHFPFRGKKILVLSGKDDKLVPWIHSERFVMTELDVGSDGNKEVYVQEGVGHECTPEMVDRMVEFVAKHALKSGRGDLILGRF